MSGFPDDWKPSELRLKESAACRMSPVSVQCCNAQVGISGCLGSDQPSCGHRGEASPTNPLFLQVEPELRLPD